MTTYTTMFKINDYFKFKVPLLESDTGDELFKVKCSFALFSLFFQERSAKWHMPSLHPLFFRPLP